MNLHRALLPTSCAVRKQIDVGAERQREGGSDNVCNGRNSITVKAENALKSSLTMEVPYFKSARVSVVHSSMLAP